MAATSSSSSTSCKTTLTQLLSQKLSQVTTMSSLKSSHALLLTSNLIIHYHPLTLSLFNSLIISSSPSPSSFLFYKHLLLLVPQLSPNHITFPFLLKSSHSSPTLGLSLLSHITKLGFSNDIFIINHSISMFSSWGDMSSSHKLFHHHKLLLDVVSWTTMITGYVSSKDLDCARLMFDWSPCKNLVTWNIMVAGYARAGRVEDAWKLFGRMHERNEASWGSLVSGFVESGCYGEALVGFRRMLEGGGMANEPMLVSVVSACSQLRSLEHAEWVAGFVEQRGLGKKSLILGTALVDMFGKCGNIRKAIKTFNEMPVKNVYSWNSLIKGLAMSGSGRQALTLFWKMRLTGIQPNSITFIGLLTACSHCGLVEEGRWFFDIMTRYYNIRPLEEHYGCMVDLLARAGLMKEALNFIDGMPVDPHAGLLGALASACRIHGDVKLGEDVAKRLIEMEPEHGGRYVLLANIYAAARRWDDMAMVRKLLKERKVVKVAGNSLVGFQQSAAAGTAANSGKHDCFKN